MECGREYYCRCCYNAGELEMLSSQALDIYTLICNPQGLEDDGTQIFACFRCREFLKEVHYFRDEHYGEESATLDIKRHEVDSLLRSVIDENSAKTGIKTEIIDECVEMDQIDIKIEKMEMDSDPESLQQISEIPRESLLVSNVEKSEIDVHNSLKLNENSLLIEQSAIPYIETSKSISRPLKLLGKVLKKNHNGLFKCNECSHETTRLGNLKEHIRYKHSEDKPFFCDQCNYQCKSKSSLSTHVITHLKITDRPFKCNECSHATTTLGNLKNHIAYKHCNEKPFLCDQCDYRCKSKASLYSHSRTHSQTHDRTFKCSECSHESKTLWNLRRHIKRIHSEQKWFSCEECSHSCKSKSALSKHKNTHLTNRDKLFKCNECSYATTAARYLKIHIRRKHCDERPFSCDHCDYNCKIKLNLYYHMKMHLANPDKPYKCNECSYVTTTATYLENHIRSKHCEEKPFSCDNCDYKCKRKTNLYIHMKKHDPGQGVLFKCNECSHETTTASNLRNHIKHKHNDEKPFHCEQCDYRCKSKSSLSSHSKTHLTNRDKPYKCDECSFETTTPKLLRSHMFSKHSDKRPFSCDHCDYKCKRKTNLYIHMQKHNPDLGVLFKCNECSHETTTIGNLKNHIKYKHSDERPFHCDQCDYRCKSKYILSSHSKTHLTIRDKPYKCNECSFKALTPSLLRRHVFSKHSDERPFSCDQCDYRCKQKSDLTRHVNLHLSKQESKLLPIT